MAALSVLAPYPIFNDRDGLPIDDGNIYIGTVNLDPVTNPIQVYWDEALTIPASQPIKTNGGYPSFQGTPSTLYVNADDFSITVKDKNNLLVYTALQASLKLTFDQITGTIGADRVTYGNETVEDALDTLFENRFVDSIADLSSLSYLDVSAGNKVYAKKEDILFEVLEANASNAPYDYTPTNGVKLTYVDGIVTSFSAPIKQTAFTKQQALDMADDISAMSGYALSAGTNGGVSYSTYWVLNASNGTEQNSLRWAIEQARSAGGGKILFYPRGEFDIHLTAQILIPDNVTIDAPGRNARIWAPFDVTRFKVTGENIIIRRLQFGATPNPLTITLRDAIWIEPSTADKVWVDQCSFQWAGDACIDMTTLVELTADCRVTVSRCYFHIHDKGSLIGSLVCYQLAGRPTWCPTALSDQTIHLYVTMRENFWHCVGQRQPKVVSQAFVDSVNNAVRMAPFQRDDGTAGACYGIFTATGGTARSTNDVFISAYGTGYEGTNASVNAYVPPAPGVLTVEGPGAMDVNGSIAADGITLTEQQTSFVPNPPYTISPLPVTNTPAGRRAFVETIQANAGASANNVAEGLFRWESASTVYPNTVTSLSETAGDGRWLRTDRWDLYPDYTSIGIPDPATVYPRGPTRDIVSGAITIPANGVYFAVDTEGGAATDDLDTIAATTDYRMIILRSASSSRDITIKNATGNIRLASGDYIMGTTINRITLMYEDPYWYELSRA